MPSFFSHSCYCNSLINSQFFSGVENPCKRKVKSHVCKTSKLKSRTGLVNVYKLNRIRVNIVCWWKICWCLRSLYCDCKLSSWISIEKSKRKLKLNLSSFRDPIWNQLYDDWNWYLTPNQISTPSLVYKKQLVFF